MYKIPVFSCEIDDGVAEKVQASMSIAVCAQAQPAPITDDWKKKVQTAKLLQGGKVIAGLTDGDLYPVKSILASTSWNRNDDIFDALEVWSARGTPVHKPDNIGHNEKVIIGHMVDCWAVDEEGKLIANDTAADKLPSFYHLINNSVIYTTWSDEAFAKEIKELIEKIEAGEMFVSMECIFRGFDYGVVTPDGENKIIARNKETAFLTKHLRAYGGTGTYDNHKVGRVMRNMIFSGKGYVEKPANPDSVILSAENNEKFFSSAEINTVFEKKGVLIPCKADLLDNKETNDMSEGTNKVLEDQIADLKASNKALADKYEALSTSATQAQVEAAKQENKALADKLATAEASLKTAQTELDAAKAEKAAAEKAKTEAETAKASVEEELKKVQAETVKAQRVSILIAAGNDEATAKANAEKFSNLNDEQFAVVAEAIKAAFPPMDDKKKDDKKKDKKDDKSKADAAAVESLEKDDTEVDLGGTSDAGAETGDDNLKKLVASWFTKEAKTSKK